MIGAIILLVLRSLSIEEAYESINWPVIFLIALLVPIGIAMEKTGTGYYLSEWIVEISKVIGPTPDIQAIRIISILYFITFITSAFVSNAAVAIILSPLAIILGQYFYTNFGGPGPIPLDAGRTYMQKWVIIGLKCLMATHFGSLDNFGKAWLVL